MATSRRLLRPSASIVIELHRCYMKHTLSCLADLEIEIVIDRQQREVTLRVDTFDSELIADCVCRILPLQHGVVAYCDDNVKNDLWQTRRATYSLFVELAGILHHSQVVQLMSISRVAVTLRPPRPIRRSRAMTTLRRGDRSAVTRRRLRRGWLLRKVCETATPGNAAALSSPGTVVCLIEVETGTGSFFGESSHFRKLSPVAPALLRPKP
jgi:hypothetical protein